MNGLIVYRLAETAKPDHPDEQTGAGGVNGLGFIRRINGFARRAVRLHDDIVK